MTSVHVLQAVTPAELLAAEDVPAGAALVLDCSCGAEIPCGGDDADAVEAAFQGHVPGSTLVRAGMNLHGSWLEAPQ
jgi:hypothetical protein